MKSIRVAATAVTLGTTLIAAPLFADADYASIVEEYIEVVVNGREYDRIDEFVAEDLIQRNPQLPNGREPLRDFWTEFMGSQPEARFNVVRIISEGAYVVKHSLFQSTPQDRGVAVVDIFRLEDGLIVEHWDVVQPVPETTVNGNHPVLQD